MVFLTSLQSIIPIVLLISLGYFLKGRGMFNPTFSSNLSRFIMSVILPAGVFVSVLHHLHMSDLWDLRYGMLVVMLTYVIAYIVAFIMMKLLKVPKGRRGIFINMVVNDNCLFIGLPVQIALFGPEALPYFLLYYIGNTISVWLVGVFLIELDPLPTVENGLANDEWNQVGNSSSVQSTTDQKPKFDWKKLLPPPLLGFFTALIFLFFEIPLAPILHNTLNYLGNMVTPLSLIYIGIVLHDAGLKSMSLNKDSIGGIVGRFVISPIIMFCVIMALQYGAGIVLEPIAIITFVVQSAGPVIAVLPIVANEAKSDLPFATGLVMISTILFVVVIPIIMEILTIIGIQA
ncbi:MAG: AEC family transporter [Veillonella sp.]|uniref:AEC family transporter n=1 Tax=Veillonella sp. TaxID=1926307 RepID=UPI00290AAC6A|nr:AEC family transporter [Veillonella sp.]MDU5004585.1 AEC family transporter [Veillonella sp.]